MGKKTHTETKHGIGTEKYSGSTAYAVGIVNIIKAFYGLGISFGAAWILIITAQVLGYGWAGLLRKYVVEPAHMWWPSTLVQISLFRTLHEKETEEDKAGYKVSRAKFFVIAMVISFLWYLVPGYLFQSLSSISWVCWAFPNSVLAQQIGSGLNGLGVRALTLDWSAVGVILPGHPIANVCFGTYGYMSMAQSISFLSDFKLGHYMKIPPRSMFLVQFIRTIIAGTINLGVAWWLLDSIDNICHKNLLPANSPWTCPGDRFFFGASFPKQSWIPLINLPVLLGATAAMPPATAPLGCPRCRCRIRIDCNGLLFDSSSIKF